MKKLMFLALLLSSLTVTAQNDPQKMIDEFFKIYQAKNSDAALDYIFGTNKWMDNSKNQIDEVKLKLNGTLKQLGDYAGYEFITRKAVGDRYVLHTFMVRYDRQPLRFSLLFYKASDEWKLMNFSYDDNLDDELEEASKAFRLKHNLEY